MDNNERNDIIRDISYFFSDALIDASLLLFDQSKSRSLESRKEMNF